MAVNFLSASELSRPLILDLLASADAYGEGRGRRHPDAVVGLAFFSESVRTRVGFEVAAARLEARTTTLLRTKHSEAMGYAESTDDALRCIGDWCDVLCIRHRDPALAGRVAPLVEGSVINCGNGHDEHPTQALVDLLAIRRQVGAIDGLRIALVGNLMEMRAAHSLVLLLAGFPEVFVRAIAPAGLGLPDALTAAVRARGLHLEASEALSIADVDVVYVAGLPAGRPGLPDLTPQEQASYRISPAVLAGARPGLRVLCPLPRLDEIDRNVDGSPHAGYFEQSKDGLLMRMAVLDWVLSA